MSLVAPYRGGTVSFARRIAANAEAGTLGVLAARIRPGPGREEPILLRELRCRVDNALRILHALHLDELVAGYSMRCRWLNVDNFAVISICPPRPHLRQSVTGPSEVGQRTNPGGGLAFVAETVRSPLHADVTAACSFTQEAKAN